MTNKVHTARAGYDISNESEMMRDAFRDYSQYLVGLAFLLEPEDEKTSAECYFFSGFVMQFGRESQQGTSCRRSSRTCLAASRSRFV
jgi:hypothetical protein